MQIIPKTVISLIRNISRQFVSTQLVCVLQNSLENTLKKYAMVTQQAETQMKTLVRLTQASFSFSVPEVLHL